MSTVLVGSTGFVGSNLLQNTKFDLAVHSSNVSDAYGTNPDLLVYAGVPAEMFTANHSPADDLRTIKTAAENIRKINPKKIVLISTAAVYANPICKTEQDIMELSELSAYGLHRYFLECWVQDNFKDYLIIRLPALYGKNLKKNFIYDLIRFVPGLLKEEKYAALSAESDAIRHAYLPRGDGFYKVKECDRAALKELKQEFKRVGFSALCFTDSRSRYQFYNLAYLWNTITRAIEAGITKLNITTEPLTAAEVYRFITGKSFENQLSGIPYNYDLRTVHAQTFGGGNGYLYDKSFVLNDLKTFVERNMV